MAKQLLLELAFVAIVEDAGPAGISLMEVPGFEYKASYRCFRKCREMGWLFAASIGHRTMRIFRKVEWALAYSANRRLPAPAEKKSGSGVKWAPDAQPVFPVDASGQPLYKVTICPSRLSDRPTRTNTHSMS